MIFLLAYFVATAFLLKRRVAIYHPGFITTVVWLIVTMLSSLGLVEFPTGALSIKTTIFVIACHSLYVIGTLAYRGDTSAPRVRFLLGTETLIFAAVGGLFVAVQMFSTLSAGNIPVLDATANLEQARLQYFLGETSVWLSISRILAYPTIGYCCLLPIFLKNKNYWHVALVLACLVSLVDLGFQEGGRSLIVFTLIMIATVAVMTYRFSFTRYVILGLVGLFIVFNLMTTFYLARNQNFALAPEYFVEINCFGGKMSPEVAESPPTVQAFALSSCYLTAPVRLLDDYLDRDIDHTLGAYNLSILYPFEFENIRSEIAFYYYSQGYGENPWATSMRDMWVDFWYFAVLAFFPLGLLIGYFTKNGYIRSEAEAVRYAAAVVAAVMLPFISPLIIRYIVYPIAVTWIIAFIAHATRSPENARPPARDQSGVPQSKGD